MVDVFVDYVYIEDTDKIDVAVHKCYGGNIVFRVCGSARTVGESALSDVNAFCREHNYNIVRSYTHTTREYQ